MVINSTPSLLDLQVARYQFECRFLENAVLPFYKGSTLRGGLGQALQRVASPSIYRFFFEPDWPRDFRHPIVRHDSQAPRPYILEPPPEDQQMYHAGSLFRFHVILVARAVQELLPLIHAVQALGEIGLGKGRAQF